MRYILGVLFALGIFLSSGQTALATTVFSQEPVNEKLNGPILNSPYLVMFGCRTIWCGAQGKTVYNVGMWLKRIGNPADIRLQVVDTYQKYPVSDPARFSNSISATTVSDTSYTLIWFHFPGGIVFSDTQYFMPQFTGANNTYNRTDYYSALYDPVNSYNAPMQWCKIYIGCYSSRFFWKMDDEKTDLSLPTPPPDPCISTNTCASNVLFLPGLEASRLYRPDYNGGTDKLWEPNNDSDAEDLLLTDDGDSVRHDIYTRDVLDEAYSISLDIYKSFIRQMDELKASGVVTDWKAVPYDWRLSLEDILNNGNQFPDGRIYYAGDLSATSSPYIIQELRRLAKSSKTGKVTIVAHSNGGLLTKALTEKLGSEASALIDKIIFVAVPQAGTPQAVGALLHGYEQGLPKDWLSIFLTPGTARTLAKNMPSVYNLLPSASYFTQVDNPVVDFDDSDMLAEFRTRYGSSIHDGAQLRNFITDTRRLASSSPSNLLYPSVGNATLLSRSETLHATLDTWTPPQGVSLYEVAGWGEDTLSAIKYREGKKASCSSLWDIRTCAIKPVIMYDPVEVVEGDGTVLVPSALWTPAAKYWVNLSKYNMWWLNGNISRKHADILEIPELRTLIQNILTNASSTPFAFITTAQPATNADEDKRLRFLLHSPLNLSATDRFGNIVNSATSTIPGSRFKRYGEVQMLTVPAGAPITLNLDGYATGSFTLDMQEINESNTVIASSTFSAIPSATSTEAVIIFPDGTIQNALPIRVDYDGNGITDFSLESKIGEEVIFDVTPPEAFITFDPISQEFRIIGTDNLSSTSVSTIATSTIIVDSAGNTLQINFKKIKQEEKHIKIEIQELLYNGVSAGASSKTVLQYEWSTDKNGIVKELQEKATVGPLRIDGHYDAKKNVTKIGKDSHLGLIIFGIRTEKGSINIDLIL